MSEINIAHDLVALFVLMRTDLKSLNPGKAVAQGTHAANQCLYELPDEPEYQALRAEWERESGHGFGTCYVYGASEKQMRDTVKRAHRFKLHAGIVHDDSYPLKDGQAMHVIALDTCGYVFGRKSKVNQHFLELELMD